MSADWIPIFIQTRYVISLDFSYDYDVVPRFGIISNFENIFIRIGSDSSDRIAELLVTYAVNTVTTLSDSVSRSLAVMTI
jgi:hypothetical protein